MNKRVRHTETVDIQHARNAWQRAEGAFPKKCSCGAVYQESDWASLPFHGIFNGTDEDTGRQFCRDLEIRVCVCGSSMAVKLKKEIT